MTNYRSDQMGPRTPHADRDASEVPAREGGDGDATGAPTIVGWIDRVTRRPATIYTPLDDLLRAPVAPAADEDKPKRETSRRPFGADEREERYAEAIYEHIVDQPAHMTETGPLVVSGLPRCYARPMSELAVPAVMALADAEIEAAVETATAELRAEVEHWKHHAWEAGEGFKRAIDDAVNARHRRRDAEAERDAAAVARVEAATVGHAIADLMRAFSHWLNGTYAADLCDEVILWRRVGKIQEEAGEVRTAAAALVGENPRKPLGSLDDLLAELSDCVCAALGAIEHLTGHEGRSLDIATERARAVCARVGVTVAEPADSKGGE